MMEIPKLIMHSVQAKIGLTTTPASLKMEQPQADLEIKQPQADMEMSVTPGKLTIDQTQAWEELDRKHIFKRIEEASQKGRQDVMEGIARTAEEGAELMRIENGANPIASQAKRNAALHKIQLGENYAPSFSRVKVQYTPSQLEINVTPHKPVIQAEPHKPVVEYMPGDVKVDMLQYPDLKIEVEYPKE
ncbi:YviE [Bacillus atrophaeus UCMB-5137]|nr:YviE [Bacillus atrophaeus UCMB-5137]